MRKLQCDFCTTESTEAVETKMWHVDAFTITPSGGREQESKSFDLCEACWNMMVSLSPAETPPVV